MHLFCTNGMRRPACTGIAPAVPIRIDATEAVPRRKAMDQIAIILVIGHAIIVIIRILIDIPTSITVEIILRRGRPSQGGVPTSVIDVQDPITVGIGGVLDDERLCQALVRIIRTFLWIPRLGVIVTEVTDLDLTSTRVASGASSEE